jgi:hypothetical protein
MRIEYICHSCLYFDAGDVRFVIDPWIKGPAYHGQWFLFPPPVKTDHLKDVDAILYSHGHEDHLHEESLGELPQDAAVYFPYQWRKGVRSFFRKKGFENLTEAISFKKYRLSPSTTVSYVAFGLESVIVINHNDKVIVNINDALNSHHQRIVDMFLAEIRKRWPRIDILFSGWSGAGYFPNMVHFDGKNDREVALIREQYFANNLCKITAELQPAAVAPFAPGFVLLGEENRWINDIKFPRGNFEDYYRKHFDKNTPVSFDVLYPGDVFDEMKFLPLSPCYAELKNGSLHHTIGDIYKSEIEQANKMSLAAEEEVSGLIKKLKKFIGINKNIYPPSVRNEVCFAIRLKNVTHENVLRVSLAGNSVQIDHLDNIPGDVRLCLTSTTDLLHYSLDHLWGGDALTIGYGMNVTVFDADVLEKNLDIVCVRLVTRYPRATRQLIRNPLRALKYYATNPMLGTLALRQKLMFKNQVNKFPYNERDHWISFTRCELCQVCNLPLLNFEFGEHIAE